MAVTLENIEPLTKRAIERFVAEALARQKDNVVKIVLFGSVARGNQNKRSDIDMFLLMKNYSLTGKVSDDLIQSSIVADEENGYETYTAPFALSVANYADSKRIGAPIIKNITEEGIVLYDAGK